MSTVNDDTKNPASRRDTFTSPKVLVAYAICWAITLGTMLSSIYAYVFADNTFEKMAEHIILCVTTFVLLHVPLALRKRYHYHVPSFIQISVAILIFAHFVLGEVFRFYDHVVLFDKFLHITNGLVIAACGFSIVYGFSKTEDGLIKLSPFFAAMFSFCFAITLLTLWEMLEYMIDAVAGYNMQRWRDSLAVIDIDGIKEFARTEIDGVSYYATSLKRGSGLIDTMHDLMIGAIGAVVVSVIGWMKLHKDPDYTRFLIVRKKPENGVNT